MVCRDDLELIRTDYMITVEMMKKLKLTHSKKYEQAVYLLGVLDEELEV